MGIFDSDGNLLASTTVMPSDTLINGFRYRNLLTPLTLTSGVDYRIAAVMGDKTYAYNSPFPPPGWSVHPSIEWAFPAESSVVDGTLQFPDNEHSERWGYFGPNFLIRDANPVPEPGWLQLPALLALGGLSWWRRRKD